MTKQFERLYKGRTAVERVNARFKLYWGADDGNVVGAQRFHAMVGVVMLVHLALGTALAGKGRGTIKTLGGTRLSPIATRSTSRSSVSDPKREGWTMATPFEIPQHRYRYPQGDSLPLAPPEKRLRKRLARRSHRRPRGCPRADAG